MLLSCIALNKEQTFHLYDSMGFIRSHVKYMAVLKKGAQIWLVDSTVLLRQGTIKQFQHWVVTPCNLAEVHQLFEERISSIFTVEECAKQETSNRQAAIKEFY